MGIDEFTSKTWSQNNKFNVRAIGGPLEGTELCIKSVSLPDFTRSAVEEYYNSIWNITYGRPEVYIITLTYVDNEEDNVYKKIFGYWNSVHEKYPADTHFGLVVYRTRRSNNNAGYTSVTFEKCILDSISGQQLDHSTQNTLMEFTVTVKAKVAYPQ